MIRRSVTALISIPFAVLPVAAQETVRLDAASISRAGVLVRPVLERSFGDSVPVFGEVVQAPGQTLTIKTPVDGRVSQFGIRPGETARAGDPLLVLHSHELHELEGELLRAREQMRLASLREEAGVELLALEGISRMEQDRRVEEARAARIHYDEVRHELEDLGYRRPDIERLLESGELGGNLVIRAPADGAVLDLAVQQHEWVEAYAPLLVFGDPGDLELEVKIQPSDAPRVAFGDMIDFVPVGRTEAAGRARVLTPIPRVDPATRTVTVRATILESAEMLYPGVFVEGMLTHGSARRALSVPEPAVIRIGGRDYVFVAAGDPGVFTATPVTLGRFNGSRYEIVEGLEDGQEVAVQGVFLLKSALIGAGGGE